MAFMLRKLRGEVSILKTFLLKILSCQEHRTRAAEGRCVWEDSLAASWSGLWGGGGCGHDFINEAVKYCLQ